MDDLNLHELLIGAGESPPDTRIEFRDPIARHGPAAVAAMSPWLRDPRLAAFAIRVIRRAADFEARAQAIRALEDAIPSLVDVLRQDAEKSLADLLPGSRGRSPGDRRPPAHRSQVNSAPAGVDQLVEGRTYRRRDLHERGFGGNRQKGISYAAGGTDAFLFSDPSKVAEWGYRDTWVGNDIYRYYGEWSGTGDMTLSGGNREIIDRSPNLYLFTKTTQGHQFAGRFRCRSWQSTPAVREGRQWMAIVFDLERVGAHEA